MKTVRGMASQIHDVWRLKMPSRADIASASRAKRAAMPPWLTIASVMSLSALKRSRRKPGLGKRGGVQEEDINAEEGAKMPLQSSRLPEETKGETGNGWQRILT